jgi:nucleoside-diphosphate-sugar epimerase
MKYLVLGSAGQIGKPLCEYLEKKGHTVLTYDIASKIEQDLRGEPTEELRSLVDSCDFVFFLAFDVGGSLYLKRYEKSLMFLRNNTDIMRNTFSLLHRVPKPFIFASSQMSNMLYSPYGVLKQLGEHYTKSLRGLSVKFWNVYGPEEDAEKAHVITDFVKMARKGKIECRTSGEELRQFLYVEDACEALYTLSCEYYNIDPEEPFHITSFKWSSVKQVAEILADKLDCILSFAAATDEVQKDARNEADENILKYWKPKTSLVDGIHHIVEYYNEEV